MSQNEYIRPNVEFKGVERLEPDGIRLVTALGQYLRSAEPELYFARRYGKTASPPPEPGTLDILKREASRTALRLGGAIVTVTLLTHIYPIYERFELALHNFPFGKL